MANARSVSAATTSIHQLLATAIPLPENVYAACTTLSAKVASFVELAFSVMLLIDRVKVRTHLPNVLREATTSVQKSDERKFFSFPVFGFLGTKDC